MIDLESNGFELSHDDTRILAELQDLFQSKETATPANVLMAANVFYRELSKPGIVDEIARLALIGILAELKRLEVIKFKNKQLRAQFQ